MKREYTRTMMIANLVDAKVTLYVYEGCKYRARHGKARKVVYDGIAGYDIIVGGKEAEEIEAETDASGVDEFHEYLVLHLLNGETATFRNSHVDMFFR